MKKHTKKAMPLIIGMVMFMNSAYADEHATQTIVPAADSVIEITEIAPGRGKMVREGKEVEVKINRAVETKPAPETKAVVEKDEESSDEETLTAEEQKFQAEYDKLACEAKSESAGIRYAECLIKNLKQIQLNSESRKYNSEQQEEYAKLYESAVEDIKNGLTDMFKVSTSASKDDNKFEKALSKISKDFEKMIKPLKRVDETVYADLESMSSTLIAQLGVEREASVVAEREKLQLAAEIRQANQELANARRSGSDVLVDEATRRLQLLLTDSKTRRTNLDLSYNSTAQLGLIEAQFGLTQNKLSFMNDNFERALKALDTQIASFNNYGSRFVNSGQIANQVFTVGRGIMSGTGLTSIPAAGSYFETGIGNNTIASDNYFDRTSIGSNRNSVIPQPGQAFSARGGLNGGDRLM